MGLLNKIFRPDAKAGPPSVPPSGSHFHDTGGAGEDQEADARPAVRRELVQVTLRETMRRHAVPSDWLELRLLPAVTRAGKRGLHVQLVVRQGQGSLLAYIPAFQSALMAEIEKIDAHAWEWLLSISWQFAGITSTHAGEMPGAGEWKMGSAVAGAAAVDAADSAPAALDDDVAQDLEALFAIRDAAMKDASPGGQADFESTRPGGAGS